MTPPSVDEASFVLGKLSGQMEDVLKEMKDINKKIDTIEKSLNHQKVKQSGLSATVALVFTMIYTFFMEHFKRT